MLPLGWSELIVKKGEGVRRQRKEITVGQRKEGDSGDASSRPANHKSLSTGAVLNAAGASTLSVLLSISSLSFGSLSVFSVVSLLFSTVTYSWDSSCFQQVVSDTVWIEICLIKSQSTSLYQLAAGFQVYKNNRNRLCSSYKQSLQDTVTVVVTDRHHWNHQGRLPPRISKYWTFVKCFIHFK